MVTFNDNGKGINSYCVGEGNENIVLYFYQEIP